jgi:hypothetical protein
LAEAVITSTVLHVWNGAVRCDECLQPILVGAKYVQHTAFLEIPGTDRVIARTLRECVVCAARNGRPGFAEPDCPERPLDLGGIA